MEIVITRAMIDNALKFYSIFDNNYKMKCYKCVDEIQKNSEYQDKVNNIYNLLFIDNNNKIRELWNIKNTSDLFGKFSNPFITNVLLIAICFEYMIIRMSILFLMYSFIFCLILKKWRG